MIGPTVVQSSTFREWLKAQAILTNATCVLAGNRRQRRSAFDGESNSRTVSACGASAPWYRYANPTSKPRTTEMSPLHLSIKPVELIADTILDCTAAGEFVLDSFMRAGTSLISAERIDRVCRTFGETEEENNGRAE